MDEELDATYLKRAEDTGGYLNELADKTVCDIMVVNKGRPSQPVTPGILVACAQQFRNGTIRGVHNCGLTEFHTYPGDNDAAVLVLRDFVNQVLHPEAASQLEHEVASELTKASGGVFCKWLLRVGAMWTQQDDAMCIAKSEESVMERHEVVFACRIDPSNRQRKIPGTDIVINHGDVWIMTTARPADETPEQSHDRKRLETAIHKKRKVVRRSKFMR